jgi:hypothetical protein
MPSPPRIKDDVIGMRLRTLLLFAWSSIEVNSKKNIIIHISVSRGKPEEKGQYWTN